MANIRRATWAFGLGVLFVAYSVVLAQRLLPPAAGMNLSYAVQGGTLLVAGVLLWRRSPVRQVRLRRARRLVSVAMMFGALSVGVAAVSGREPATPSLVDLLQFLWLPIAFAGLLAYPRTDDRPGSSLRTFMDALLAALGLWFVTYMLVLRPRIDGNTLSMPELLLTIAHPVADVLAVAMVVGVLTRVCDRARPELSLLAGGLLLAVVSDVAWAGLAMRGSHPASWVAIVAEGGLLLLVAGACAPSGSMASRRLVHQIYDSLPFWPIGAVAVVVFGIAIRGGAVHPDGLALGATLVIVLLARQVVGGRDRTALTDRLRLREELFRSLVTGTSDLILLFDADGTALYASPALARVTGIERTGVLDFDMYSLVHPDDLPQAVEQRRIVSSTAGATAEIRLRLRTAEGEWRWFTSLGHNLLHDPSVRGIIYNARDVHERHLLEQQVTHDASHDALTGLGNLARARGLLAAACAAADGDDDCSRGTTVILVDLDGFKTVNDTYGHAHGDALLEAVAQRLLGCVRAGDEVTRIGGDEFLLVLGGATDGAEVSERILISLRRPLMIEGKQFSIGASLGLATTAHSPCPEDLLRNADLAMYAAKAAGRGRAAWYEPRMHESATRRMEVHAGLRRALDEGHLALHYQPIVRLPGGQVVGLEALLRWTDPEMGPVFPDVFIPVAEESGLMAEIDCWVLDRACRDAAAWLRQGVECPPISVNVSRTQVTEALPSIIAAALTRHGLAAASLCIEITESAVVPDPDSAIGVLQGLRTLGVAISLDDFGTGQSSLSQLARLPVDTVKIDKSFILSSRLDGGAQRLLTSIIGVCKALELPVVAEGIEDQAVVGYLAGQGCEFGQGYHFGRPTPASDVGLVLLRGVNPGARMDGRDAVDVSFT